MKYMLLVYMDEKAMSESERQDCNAESAQLAQDIHARGKYLGASPLQPVALATSLRIRNGRSLITDGPFAETREQLGGFYLIDAKDLDDALGIAARIPAAHKGTIEVRPLRELTGLP